MADPILVDHFRALSVFQGLSGLPEDRFVCSFAFRNDAAGSAEAAADNIANAVSEFWFSPFETGTSVSSYMPPAFAGWECRVYDLGTTPPRAPMIKGPAHTMNWGTGSRLPAECAVCLSTRTADRTARGRGRLFIGPLLQTSGVDVSGLLAVAPALRDLLALAAGRLMDRTDVTWVLISGRDTAAKPITGGYVDDAYDTQRRRGIAPTVRTPWGAYQAPA